MTRIARTPTYSREATRETSFHGLTPPHFSGAFELFGHASRGERFARLPQAGRSESGPGQEVQATRSMLKMPTLKEMSRHFACFFSCGGLLQQPARGRGAGFSLQPP